MEGPANAHGPRTRERKKYFTVEEADAALVLVKRIVRDVVRQFASLLQCQEEVDAAARGSPQREAARQKVRHAFGRLQQYRDELLDLGAELKDWGRGVVHFPAWVDGREVSLCWRHGEQRVACWHEPTAGRCRRKRIDPALPFACPGSDAYQPAEGSCTSSAPRRREDA